MTPRTSGTALRGVAAFCALTSAVLHLLLAPSHLEEKFYIGVLFVIGGAALLYAAAGLFRRNPWPAWLVGAPVSAGMIAGFALSRTIGLPGFRADGWEPPYGPLSLTAEVAFILAFAAWLRTRGMTTSVLREPARTLRHG